ncbi:hypothetical protein HOLleu_01077 [Holothuria leucospilota]|uniref:Uncharacterized protein n=1 Tax=Holothuria leucospilota TaxID=206669 RepID=A0A9Q1CNU4_HOLLE|nr:hypothetical protein HOLleu_01077 [Holothuria leucospilota]
MSSMEHTKKMVLVSPDYLERVTSTFRPSQSPETAKTRVLEDQLSAILHDPHLDDASKLRRYSDLLQRYQTYDIKSHEPVKMKIVSESSSETKPEAQNVSGSPQKDIENDVLESLPKAFKGKAVQLLRKINSSNGDLSWTDKGELIVKDRVIKGSHMVDLINDVVRKRKGIIPIGATDFAKELAELNLPRELVGNPDRWKEMTRGLEDPTPEIDSSTKSPKVGALLGF